jgi:hypothetical protein
MIEIRMKKGKIGNRKLILGGFAVAVFLLIALIFILLHNEAVNSGTVDPNSVPEVTIVPGQKKIMISPTTSTGSAQKKMINASPSAVMMKK